MQYLSSISAIEVFNTALGGLAIGILTNLFWEYIKETVNYSAAYPKMKGEWIVNRMEPNHPQEGHERVLIKHQFLSGFKGVMKTPTADGSELIQEVRGRFIAGTDRAIYSFYLADPNKPNATQIGAGLLIKQSSGNFLGKSVYSGTNMLNPIDPAEISHYTLSKLH